LVVGALILGACSALDLDQYENQETGGTTASGGVGATGSVGATGGQGGTTSTGGTGGCSSDNDCTTSSAPRCKLSSGTCVECLDSNDCYPAKPKCENNNICG